MDKIFVEGAGATFPEALYADAFFAFQFVDDTGPACLPENPPTTSDPTSRS